MEEILGHLVDVFPIIIIIYNPIIESVSQLLPILPNVYQLVEDFVHPQYDIDFALGYNPTASLGFARYLHRMARALSGAAVPDYECHISCPPYKYMIWNIA